MRMEDNTTFCLVCLKSLKHFRDEQDEEAPRFHCLNSTFWNFAKDYLGGLDPKLGGNGKALLKEKEAFCEECEDVLGFHNAAHVGEIRNSLKRKCLLKRRETLPQILIERLKIPLPDKTMSMLSDNIKLEVISADLLEEMGMDIDSNDGFSMDLESPDEIFDPLLNDCNRIFPRSLSPLIPISSKDPHHPDVEAVSLANSGKEEDNGKKAHENESPIKTEPLSSSEEEEKIEEKIHPKRQRLKRHPSDSSLFEPDSGSESRSSTSDSDSDWDQTQTKGKKRKHSVAASPSRPSTSKKKASKTPSLLLNENETEFPCPTCGKGFDDPKKLRHHVYQVHGEKTPCPQCKKLFKTKSGLKEHMINIHKPEAHPCPHCEKIHKTKQYLRAHIRNSHPTHFKLRRKAIKKVQFRCELCSLVVKSCQQLNRHILEVHKGKRYQCQECKNSFKSKHGLQSHMVTFHKPEVHPCPHSSCNKTFRSKHYLKCHTNYVHPDNSKGRRSYLCPICLESYSKRKLVDQHLLTCGKSEDKGLSSTSDQKQEPRKCPTCPKRYFSTEALRRHLLTCEREQKQKEQSGKNTLTCSTSSAKKVKCDEESETEKEKGFPCESCGKVFSSSFNLRLHINRIHSGKKFICPECGKVVRTRSYLKHHIIAYHKPETHACPHCVKIFRTKEYLQGHIRFLHRDCALKSESNSSEQAQLLCEKCGKSFPSEKSKKLHFIRVHLGEGIRSSCHVCEKVFSSPYKLRRHLLSVHGLKNYSCSQCGLETKSKLELEQHMSTIHKNEAKVCPQCGKGFATEAFLSFHINDVHASKEQRSMKRYPCPHCVIGYKIQSKLDNHLLRCSKEKPMYKRSSLTGSVIKWDDMPDSNGKFPCSQCPKVCNSSLQRQRHIHHVHNEEPLTCDQCGVTRKSSSGLQRHIDAFHKPKDRVCPHCGKTLATSYMAVHIKLVHPELAPKKKVRYPCPNSGCGEGFYTKGKLEKHLGRCQKPCGSGASEQPTNV
ncbi:unnamed protein product [Orchesella dallaii]|uniref:C2H2-type domain-containing protein n=1 Tax=Orchesella dallaii TaxID=48710 RepID=A0ABP1RVZ1_9HEXA